MKKFILILFMLYQTVTAAERELIIAHAELIKPFLYKENGRLTGIDADIMQAVLKKKNFKAKFVEMPWARALRSTQLAEIDGLISVYCDRDLDNILVVDEPSYQSNVSILALKARNLKPQDLNKKNSGFVIGLIRGVLFKERLDKYPHLKIVEVTNVQSQAGMLMEGKIDFAITEELWFINYLSNIDKGDKVEVIEVLNKVDICLGFSRKPLLIQPTFLDGVSESLQQLKQTGEINRILSKHQYN